MTTATRDIREPKPLPMPNGDFYEVTESLKAEELEILNQVRAFMQAKVAPIITKYWADDAFPFEVLPALRDLKLGGLGLQGYGCKGGSTLLDGFVQMEMARVDPSFSTFFGVHNGLAMGSIYLGGSEEQKQKWLPPMARLEKIGCFGLTEPLVGSGTGGGLTTTAKRDGDTWVLNGQKKWIGNAPWCDLSIIWARDLADNQVKGFIVENKTTPGFSVEKIQNKDCVARGPERFDHDGQLPRGRREPSPGRHVVSRHVEGVAHDSCRCRVDGDRVRDGCLRICARVLPAAIAVRETDRLFSAGAGSPREDARQRNGVAMHGSATLSNAG